MTQTVETMLSTLRSRQYRKLRDYEAWTLSGATEKLNEYGLSTLFLEESLAKETPVILPGDIFGFTRHTARRPNADKEGFPVINGQRYYERYSNIVPKYDLLISKGFDAVLTYIDAKLSSAKDHQQDFYEALKTQLLAIVKLCDSYKAAAVECGNTRLYNALCNVPRKGAGSYYEACLFLKILIFSLRCGNYKHMALGRFDQYMYPYYCADTEKGITRKQLLEITELFVISLTLDTDLYEGIQQGDNGQSMVLGGFDLAGNSCYNELTLVCLEASEELALIDPKINVRVGKNTPDSIYALGTKLTKRGLGFPQYCNDDVVIPGLIALGYRPEDAADYAVAACWEFIIPGRGADIPNCTVVNLPLIVAEAVDTALQTDGTFADLMDVVQKGIQDRAEYIIKRYGTPQSYYFYRPLPVSPLVSVMMDGLLESGEDISRFSARYYNHGAFALGISTAADSLAAVKKTVFDEKTVSRKTLLQALQNNFEGHTALRNQLLACPKMGNDDDYVDTIAQHLMQMVNAALRGRSNGVGGIWRTGTGSANHYISGSRKCPATPDGRKACEPFSCSYSPAPQARIQGPLSVIRSFTKPDLQQMINGGPLTMELHDNVFRNTEGEKKVADLVKLYILSGGHQLQLNAINAQKLHEAQKDPDAYPNLVVRVWGWSGYFRELDREYQDHIIQRTEYSL